MKRSKIIIIIRPTQISLTLLESKQNQFFGMKFNFECFHVQFSEAWQTSNLFRSAVYPPPPDT